MEAFELSLADFRHTDSDDPLEPSPEYLVHVVRRVIRGGTGAPIRRRVMVGAPASEIGRTSRRRSPATRLLDRWKTPGQGKLGAATARRVPELPPVGRLLEGRKDKIRRRPKSGGDGLSEIGG